MRVGIKHELKHHKFEPRRGEAIIAQGETLGNEPRKMWSAESASYRAATNRSPFQGSAFYKATITQGFTLGYDGLAPAGLGSVPLLPSDLT